MARRAIILTASLLLLLPSAASSDCINTPNFVDMYGAGCGYYEADEHYPLLCLSYGSDGDPGMTTNENCCICKEDAQHNGSQSSSSYHDEQYPVRAYDPENLTETCYEAIFKADANGDGILQTKEYTYFIADISDGQVGTADISYDKLPFVTKVNFAHLSCRCKFEPINGGDNCCEGANVGIFLPQLGGVEGIYLPGFGLQGGTTPTPEEERYMQMVCTDTQEAIKFFMRPKPTYSPSTSSPSLGPTGSHLPTSDSPTMQPSRKSVTDAPNQQPGLQQVTNNPTEQPSLSANPVADSPTRQPAVASSVTGNFQQPSADPANNTPSMQPSATNSPTSTANPTTDSLTRQPAVASVTEDFQQPSANPVTNSLSMQPSANPSVTDIPSMQPTVEPSVTDSPSMQPSAKPSVTDSPSLQPSAKPITDHPSMQPTAKPVTISPSMHPTAMRITKEPTGKPIRTKRPTTKPVIVHTRSPLATPAESSPTIQPTTAMPVIVRTRPPRAKPTVSPVTPSPNTEEPSSAVPTTDNPTRQEPSAVESEYPTSSFPPSDIGNLTAVSVRGASDGDSGFEGETSDSLDPILLVLVSGIAGAAVILLGAGIFLLIRKKKRDNSIDDDDSQLAKLRISCGNNTDDLEASLEYLMKNQDEAGHQAADGGTPPPSPVEIRQHALEVLERVDKHEVEVEEASIADESSKSTAPEWARVALRPVNRLSKSPAQGKTIAEQVSLRSFKQSKPTTPVTASDQVSLRPTKQTRSTISASRVDQVSLRPTIKTRSTIAASSVTQVSLRLTKQSKSTIAASSVDQEVSKSTMKVTFAPSVDQKSLRLIKQSKSSPHQVSLRPTKTPSKPVTAPIVDQVPLRPIKRRNSHDASDDSSSSAGDSGWSSSKGNSSSEDENSAISASSDIPDTPIDMNWGGVGRIASLLADSSMPKPPESKARGFSLRSGKKEHVGKAANKSGFGSKPSSAGGIGEGLHSSSKGTMSLTGTAQSEPSTKSSACPSERSKPNDYQSASSSSTSTAVNAPPDTPTNMNWGGVGRIASLLADNPKVDAKSSSGFSFFSNKKGNKGKTASKSDLGYKTSSGGLGGGLQSSGNDTQSSTEMSKGNRLQPSVGGRICPSSSDLPTKSSARPLNAAKEPIVSPDTNECSHNSELDKRKQISHFNDLIAKGDWARAVAVAGNNHSLEKSEDEFSQSGLSSISSRSRALGRSTSRQSSMSSDVSRATPQGMEVNFPSNASKNTQGIGQHAPASFTKRLPLKKKAPISQSHLSKEHNAQRTALKLQDLGVDSKSANIAGKIVQEYSLKWIMRRKRRGSREEDREFDISEVISVLSEHGLSGHDIAVIFSRTPDVAMMMARTEDGLPSKEMREVLAQAASKQ